MKRVSAAPHMRSMSWRASPALARFSSRVSRLSKASFISLEVRAEKRARVIGASAFTSRMRSRMSAPISSPSRS
jgi:hypothetical protein